MGDIWNQQAGIGWLLAACPIMYASSFIGNLLAEFGSEEPSSDLGIWNYTFRTTLCDFVLVIFSLSVIYAIIMGFSTYFGRHNLVQLYAFGLWTGLAVAIAAFSLLTYRWVIPTKKESKKHAA